MKRMIERSCLFSTPDRQGVGFVVKKTHGFCHFLKFFFGKSVKSSSRKEQKTSFYLFQEKILGSYPKTGKSEKIIVTISVGAHYEPSRSTLTGFWQVSHAASLRVVAWYELGRDGAGMAVFCREEHVISNKVCI